MCFFTTKGGCPYASSPLQQHLLQQASKIFRKKNFLFTSSSGEQTLIEVPSINQGHENTLTDAISHTHETENYALYNHSHATQNFALNTHTHDFPLTTTASHTHDYSNFASIDHSHNLSNTTDTTNPYQGLNPLDSLQLNQFRQGIKESLWHTESNGLVGEIKNKSLSELAVFWDQDKQRLGIGTINPTNKLHVAREIRSQGFSNSNGSQNEPSYSFKSDTNTGIFRAAADQLAFSTKGQEQMRLTKEGHLAIGISATNSFLEVNGALSLKITQSHTQTTTLNEDQINNSINLSQYPRSRLVNFQLYDRYGVMLFKLKSMDPKSLKDRIKNNTSYTGTYFYIVHLKAPKQIEQGYIYLIKK